MTLLERNPEFSHVCLSHCCCPQPGQRCLSPGLHQLLTFPTFLQASSGCDPLRNQRDSLKNTNQPLARSPPLASGVHRDNLSPTPRRPAPALRAPGDTTSGPLHSLFPCPGLLIPLSAGLTASLHPGLSPWSPSSSP